MRIRYGVQVSFHKILTAIKIIHMNLLRFASQDPYIVIGVIITVAHLMAAVCIFVLWVVDQ